MKPTLEPALLKELEYLERLHAIEPYERVRLQELRTLRVALNCRYGPRNLPRVMYSFLEESGVDLERSLLFEDVETYQGFCIFGEVLDQNEVFWEFDVECNDDGTRVLHVNEWKVVERDLSVSRSGVPVSEAKIKLDILRKMNDAEEVSWRASYPSQSTHQ